MEEERVVEEEQVVEKAEVVETEAAASAASAASETAEWEALCLLIFDSSTWCTQCSVLLLQLLRH